MSNFEFNNSDSEDEELLIYNCEEKSKTRFNIVLCEFYNESTHGNGYPTLANYHYLVAGRFKKFHINYLNKFRNTFKFNVEIAECFDLETQERIAIIKTFWLKLIQRTWKNLFKKRKEILKRRCNPLYLKFRELNGNWPKDCQIYPCIKGMMYYLL